MKKIDRLDLAQSNVAGGATKTVRHFNSSGAVTSSNSWSWSSSSSTSSSGTWTITCTKPEKSATTAAA